LTDRTDTVITSIEQQKRKQRYNIYINEQFAFGVHEDILIKHRLVKGQAIDQARMEMIVKDDELQQAYLNALKWLGVRARTSKEVRERLITKEYTEDIVEEVLRRLREQKYIDDTDFAKRWADERVRLHKKGRRWVRQELKEKGVPEQAIHDALSEVDEETEWVSALSLGQKRWGRGSSKSDEPWQRKQRVLAFLVRRGYSVELASRVVKKLAEGEPTASDDESWEFF
jgi:regulatory protein